MCGRPAVYNTHRQVPSHSMGYKRVCNTYHSTSVPPSLGCRERIVAVIRIFRLSSQSSWFTGSSGSLVEFCFLAPFPLSSAFSPPFSLSLPSYIPVILPSLFLDLFTLPLFSQSLSL